MAGSPASASRSGALRGRFTFYSISPVDDELGTRSGDPVEEFACAGELYPLIGGETVMAARLQSTQPCNLFVRQTTRTRCIGTDWEVQDKSGTVYNIRTIVDPDQKRAWFKLLIESGVAA